jgi:hypothetical protein
VSDGGNGTYSVHAPAAGRVALSDAAQAQWLLSNGAGGAPAPQPYWLDVMLLAPVPQPGGAGGDAASGNTDGHGLSALLHRRSSDGGSSSAAAAPGARLDRSIDFSDVWGALEAAPADAPSSTGAGASAAVAASWAAMRVVWTGYLLPPATAAYTLAVRLTPAASRCRLVVEGATVLDTGVPDAHAGGADSGVLTIVAPPLGLVAAQPVHVQLYCERLASAFGGLAQPGSSGRDAAAAILQLLWARFQAATEVPAGNGDGRSALQPVPASALYPAASHALGSPVPVWLTIVANSTAGYP